MDYLPAAQEQAWLLDHLREVIEYAGRKRFLEFPIVEPKDEFFPDRWTPGPKGVKSLAKRILSHAGMGRFGVDLEIFTSETVPLFDGRGRVFSERHLADAAAWFTNLDGGACHFGVDASRLTDPPELAAILCHEVAHAFRDWKGLAYETREEDEPLTDLTTVYLGFGLLTTNVSYRYRSDTRKWAHAAGGYLSPVEMSFLLAAQVVARGEDRAARKRIAGYLETNQAAFFRAAVDALEKPEARLRAKLGLEQAVIERARAGFNRGLPVFRIKGGWFRAARCSDADCNAKLSRRDTACPGCGGFISGDASSIAEARERESKLAEDTSAADDILDLLKRS